MKKVLRFIGILLLIIIAGVLILGLIAPKETASERSMLVNAPQNIVADYMFHYKNFNDWSPWAKLDTAMTTEIIGEDNAVGTKYQWKGNDKVGVGELTTKDLKDNEMYYTMVFKEPWESTAEGYWKLQDAGNGQTKVLWGFSSPASFPMNGIMMLMGMKKMLEDDFDKGLATLKEKTEAIAKDGGNATSFKIEELQFPGHTYATIRKVLTLDEAKMFEFFTNSYDQLGKAAGKRINGPASNLVYKWDEANNQTDMAAAFPVSGTEDVKGATMATVPSGKSYMIVYTGGYKGIYAAHEQLSKKMMDSKKDIGIVIEEYIKGPGDEKDSTKWITNVIYVQK